MGRESRSVCFCRTTFLPIAALLIATALLTVFLWIRIRLSHSYSSEQMHGANTTVAVMSVPDILSAFRSKGVDDVRLASILKSSRFTLRRLRSGESSPSPSMEASIRGLYTDYLLLGESNLLFRCRYGRNGMDQYYAFHNPLQEKRILKE